MRGPWASINLAALKHNLAQVKIFAPQSNILAMLKSNAYGHGAVRVAKALSAAEGFGVATVEEAMTLREAGIKHRILLLGGCFTVEDLIIAAANQLDIVVHQSYQIDMLEKVSLPTPITVWLKINSGMNRLGFLPTQVQETYQRLNNCSNVKKPIHLMTHFADEDDIKNPSTKLQLASFKQASTNLVGPKSIANSAGIIAWPETHAEWNRPGIMLYGISPLLGHIAQNHNLQPVMSLTARLCAINSLTKGVRIGYGGTWECPTDMRVGVVAIGYGDGYPRHAKNGTPTLIHNQQCPIVGRVSMDYITVDLRNCPQAQVGDKVTLWGDNLPIETIANYCDTIAYELTCKLTSRVQFSEK